MKAANPTTQPVLAFLSWTLAVGAAWLAVGTQPWAQTFLIASVGCLSLFFPPSGGISRTLLALLFLLLLLASTAFLPAAWLGTSFHQPFQAQGIALPWTLSPQPWWSLEDLTLLLSGLLWATICLDTNFPLAQREFLITSYLLALGTVAVDEILQRMPLGQNIPEFFQHLGQFANRNQTGDLFVMGGVFSFARALSKIAKKEAAAIPWVILTVVFMIAIIMNASRAALVLFLLGLALLSILMPKKRRHGVYSATVLFFLAVVGMLISISQGATLIEGLHNWVIGNDSHLSIYQDAAALLWRVPWCGVGLGNFEGVFNVMRVHSLYTGTRNLHPESDWFWVATELGIPGAILFILLFIAIFRIYFLKSPFPDLAKPSALVAALFLIHSFFDVGGHRPGTAWSCIYLISLGTFAATTSTDIKIPQLAFRVVGFLFLVLTVFRIQSMSLHPWMPTRASLMTVEESLTQQQPPPAQQHSILDQSLTWAPLDWLLYYQRGLVCEQIPELSSQASDDFNRALYLEQSSVQLPMAVGTACYHTNLPEALAAWRELLKRSGNQKDGELQNDDIIQSLLTLPGLDEKARLEIANLAEGDPDLEARVACAAPTSREFDWYLQNLLETNPTLEGILPANLRRLFDRWSGSDESAAFVQAWPLHPAWRTPGWRAYVQALGNSGRYREAVTTALENMPTPSIPAPPGSNNVDEAMPRYLSNPQDPYNGMMLYLAQMAAGSKDQALQTLIAVTKLPNRPAYLQILLARQLLDSNQDKAAWQALDPVLHDQ